MIDASMADMDELLQHTHFRHHCPDWTPQRDGREILTTRELAVDVQSRVLPTCAGIPLFVEQPAGCLGGAKFDFVLSEQNLRKVEAL